MNAMKRIVLLCIGIFLMNLVTYAAGKEIVWFDGTNSVTYFAPKKVSPVVTVALEMLDGDLQQVTGFPLKKGTMDKANIRVVQLNEGRVPMRLLQSEEVPVDELKKKQDAFYIKIASNNQILVVGNNGRGTAYGILELSRMAGVSPWVWWSDATPEKKDRLTLSKEYTTFQSPSVEYRGIFLNDEDWTLQPWSWMHFSPSDTPGFISARTYKEIFKLLMRLRANAIWPGMHGMTTPFYLVPGAKEVADSCGIVIGTSHCEPMMRNNVGEWKVEERGEYNYMTNREAVHNYWIERLKEAGQYENFYTMGMRGIHDSGMEGVKTLQEKTDALQLVINDQRKLLAKYVNKEVEKIPQTFVPYKEVLQIMDNGLELPEDITLVWCDDNYGYMTRLSDEQQQKRSGGAGVYYHLSYWGRPHDYMWLCGTQPGLVYNEMKAAYDSNARKLWIVNVHDMKTPAYNLELFLDMAWNIDAIQPSTLDAHLKNWLCRELGDKAGQRVFPAVREFYRLCGVRRPEFMGWTQVELDKKRYYKGWSQVQNTEFSLTEFGGELDRYLDDWESVEKLVNEVEGMIPDNRKDTYFSHVKYPLLSAAAMSEKMLEAQRARSLAPGNYNPARWERDEALFTACAKSWAAYQDIRNLTDYFNNELAGGRWKYSMCDNPRDLYVFYPPQLPVGLTDKEVLQYKNAPRKKVKEVQQLSLDGCLAYNASQYNRATEGVYTVQMLGHSMNAVALPKGKSISFDFDWAYEGEAFLNVAVIPTQPNDTGDIRFSVSVDGNEPVVCSYKEGFRTESWKQNVLRGQAIRSTKHQLSKGKHTLTITALDAHVLIDQWMLDTKAKRSFYVYPVAPDYN